MSSSEAIALHLRDHQTSLKDWDYAALARELHRFVEIFDCEFKLQLPTYPVIRFDKLRNAYATYAWFRTELGTRDNITFNTHELAREPGQILATLLHELLHLWQHYLGRPPASNYHNLEFRRRAEACGLIVTPRGCHDGHTEVFTRVLAKYGVHFEPQPVELALALYGAAKREQKLKKWSCACTNVRCATELAAVCTRCHRPFARTEPVRSLPSTIESQGLAASLAGRPRAGGVA